MPYINHPLPKYPVKEDVWDILKNEKRPIVVYGMGNGADKLIERFSKYGIEIADFFASAGFVRGHFFHGKRVKSLEEIKAEHSEFVIVLSFASNREEVINMLAEIDGKHQMYVPDMPIASCEYFDKELYNLCYEDIKKAYESLSDEESKAVFSSVVNYRISGKMKFLLETYSEKYEKYDILNRKKIETVIDGGAYNGDTAKEAVLNFKGVKRIYALEPDARNFKKLSKYAGEETKCEIIPINSALYSEDGLSSFSGSGNRNSTISGTASHEFSKSEVSLVKIDSLTSGRVDYIKLDVEGAEYEALLGARETIAKHHPSMSVSLYHKSRDIFSLINYLREEYPEYKLYLRRTRCVPAWEIDLVMTY